LKSQRIWRIRDYCSVLYRTEKEYASNDNGKPGESQGRKAMGRPVRLTVARFSNAPLISRHDF
jgi:hypothetical protein